MEKMSSSLLASLLKPFGVCASYLNPEVIGFKLGAMADKVVQFISQMEADDMKDKVFMVFSNFLFFLFSFTH